jgi:hypothetical protein
MKKIWKIIITIIVSLVVIFFVVPLVLYGKPNTALWIIILAITGLIYLWTGVVVNVGSSKRKSGQKL